MLTKDTGLDGAQVCGTPSPEVSTSSPFSLTGLPHVRILGCSGHLWTFGETEAKSHCGSIADSDQGPRTPASQPWGPAPPHPRKLSGGPSPSPQFKTLALLPLTSGPKPRAARDTTIASSPNSLGAPWTCLWGPDCKELGSLGHLQEGAIPLPASRGPVRGKWPLGYSGFSASTQLS